MNFTMKILAVSVLLVAMMALALGTEAPPEAETTPGGKGSSQEKEEEKRVVKRSVCPQNWTMINETCYRYFSHPRTWAEAQTQCQSLGGNLASVHSEDEDTQLEALAHQKIAWIGYSDAQQEHYWFWIDGTAVSYKNWCRGQPNNFRNQEHCAVINSTGEKCWHDYNCFLHHFPYICARTPR